MKVVDASVAFKWLVPEVDGDKAQALHSDELHAPDFIQVEIANALHVAEIRGRIVDAQGLLNDWMLQLPAIHDSTPLLSRALEIGKLVVRRSIYDLIYIALAEELSCDFVTADQRLFNAAKLQFPFVLDLASLK